ncbi:unnamed protein product [Spirodela intermedia]|uniref:Uncharacterized protein n=1 Tax=Spirodela intermedia TaxID=51605 RepID=A0A7I8K097_SPIIN|nr:unnamed protein product [Spirodela intermedia]
MNSQHDLPIQRRLGQEVSLYCPTDALKQVVLLDELGHAEVPHLWAEILVQEYVLRLDVAVKDPLEALLMEITEPLGRSHGDKPHIFSRFMWFILPIKVTSAQNSGSPWDTTSSLFTATTLSSERTPLKTVPKPPLPISSLKLWVAIFSSA